LRICVSGETSPKITAYIFVETERITAMRLIAFGLLATLALAGPALAQSGTTTNMGAATGTAGISGPAAAGGGFGNNAGSITAAANASVNPSGNSFLNPPPGTGVPAAGRPAR
jgi:hypothetical protein